jgi:hypothetical protein
MRKEKNSSSRYGAISSRIPSIKPALRRKKIPIANAFTRPMNDETTRRVVSVFEEPSPEEPSPEETSPEEPSPMVDHPVFVG